MLAQRKSTGVLSGVLLVDGLPADGSFIRRTAYVPQYDNFVPLMTTHEVRQGQTRLSFMPGGGRSSGAGAPPAVCVPPWGPGRMRSPC